MGGVSQRKRSRMREALMTMWLVEVRWVDEPEDGFDVLAVMVIGEERGGWSANGEVGDDNGDGEEATSGAGPRGK